MSRLREALERAQALQQKTSGETAAVSTPRSATPDANDPWAFDEVAAPVAPPVSTASFTDVLDEMPVEMPVQAAVDVAVERPAFEPAAAAVSAAVAESAPPTVISAEPPEFEEPPIIEIGETAAPPARDHEHDYDRPKETHVDYPFVTDRTADKLVVGPEAEVTFVEQYRRLAASLHHAQLQTGARTVMVTSALENEGKTLTAANIALTLSHSYQRNVLLVDADLRRPSVHTVFNLSNRAGLGDILDIAPREGKLPIQQLSPTLAVMTAGRPNPDPMGGLVSETMKQFLTEAGEQFDFVIVDTPPVALLTDANLLAAMIDLALIVVSARTTPYPLVKRAIDSIGASRILGVVLNRAHTAEAAAGFGYGYSYGYSYGAYGYGYGKRPGRKAAAAAAAAKEGRRWRLPWRGKKRAT